MHHELLLHAAKQGDLKCLKKLIEEGESIDTQNSFHENLLFIACENGHAELAFYLLENNANPLQINSGKQTVFFAACKGGNIKIVKKLCELNLSQLNPTAINADELKTVSWQEARRRIKSSPIYIAVSYGHLPLIQYFTEQGFITKNNISLLFECALRQGKTNILTFMIEHGLIEASMLEGISWSFPPEKEEEIIRLIILHFDPMHTIVLNNLFKELIRNNNQFSMNFLLKKYPHLHEQFPLFFEAFFDGLHLSAEPNPIQFLLNHGLSVNTLDPEKQTLLHYAATHFKDEWDYPAEMIKLLELNYSIDEPNARQQTPLMAALEAGMFYHACTLIDRGASLSLKDDEGKTILDYAKNFRYFDCENEEDSWNLQYRQELIDLILSQKK